MKLFIFILIVTSISQSLLASQETMTLIQKAKSAQSEIADLESKIVQLSKEIEGKKKNLNLDLETFGDLLKSGSGIIGDCELHVEKGFGVFNINIKKGSVIFSRTLTAPQNQHSSEAYVSPQGRYTAGNRLEVDRVFINASNITGENSDLRLNIDNEGIKNIKFRDFEDNYVECGTFR